MAIRRLFGLAAAATLLLSAGAFVDAPGTCGNKAASWWPSSLAHAKDLKKLFEADKEACFGRTYDPAHLKAHPQQKVTSIHIFRSLRPQGSRELDARPAPGNDRAVQVGEPERRRRRLCDVP